ncbi:cyclic lactone autoinducer peptide [Limnochorda pilosa]
MILALLGFLAATNVTYACAWFWYQPKPPKALMATK